MKTTTRHRQLIAAAAVLLLVQAGSVTAQTGWRTYGDGRYLVFQLASNAG